jgi:hypothetical protein
MESSLEQIVPTTNGETNDGSGARNPRDDPTRRGEMYEVSH